MDNKGYKTKYEYSFITFIVLVITTAVIVGIFMIGLYISFNEKKTSLEICQENILDPGCETSNYCLNNYSQDIQCQIHCENPEFKYSNDCHQITCIGASDDIKYSSLCICKNTDDDTFDDTLTCQNKLCDNDTTCFDPNVLYLISNDIFNELQYLTLIPMNSSDSSYYQKIPTTINFENTGFPKGGNVTSMTYDKLSTLLNVSSITGNNIPLWRIVHSLTKPYHYWLIWAPYQLFVLSSNMNDMKLKYINPGENLRDRLDDSDLFEIEINYSKDINDDKKGYIKNKYGYLTNNDFRLTQIPLKGDKSQLWTFKFNGTTMLKNITSSQNIQCGYNFPWNDNTPAYEIKVYENSNQPAIGYAWLDSGNLKLASSLNTNNSSYFFGEYAVDGGSSGSLYTYKVTLRTKNTDKKDYVIYGSQSVKYNDKITVNSELPEDIDSKFVLQVVPNLDINAENTGVFLIRHGINSSLYVGKYDPTDNKKKMRWTYKDEAYYFRFNKSPPINSNC